MSSFDIRFDRYYNYDELNERLYPWSPWGQQWSATAKAVEWLVRASEGASITVTAAAEKAGTKRVTRYVS